MSWLVFRRNSGRVELYNGVYDRNFIGPPHLRYSSVAHNNTTANSNGAWPTGTYTWSHYNLHADMGAAPACHPTAYGCYGIHVFSVNGRSGMGVHAGRTQGQAGALGGKTLGCVRVPADAMVEINNAHNADPLTHIIVDQ